MIRPDADTIYLYRHPVDMRKAINGLVAIVEGEMALDPFNASLFVFCNRALLKNWVTKGLKLSQFIWEASWEWVPGGGAKLLLDRWTELRYRRKL